MNRGLCLGLFLLLLNYILTISLTAQEFNYTGVKILETEYFERLQLLWV